MTLDAVLACSMTTTKTDARTSLLGALRKIQKIAHKGPNHKVDALLNGIVAKHTKRLPGDKVLLALVSQMSNAAFCDHVVGLFTDDITARVKLVGNDDKPTGAAPPSRRKAKSVVSELLKHYRESVARARVALDPSNVVPSEGEVAAYHRSILGVIKPFEIQDLYDLFARLREAEETPLLVPLYDRLESLFSTGLARFLPIEQILEFLTTWDGTEASLVLWKSSVDFAPIGMVLRDGSMAPTLKKAVLSPMMEHLSRSTSSGKFTRLTLAQIQEAFRLSQGPTHPGFLRVVARMDLGRRLKVVDQNRNIIPKSPGSLTDFAYLWFWDLGTRFMARRYNPVLPTASSSELSDAAFAVGFFSSESRQRGNVFFLNGDTPYNVEYTDAHGHVVVQDAEIYDSLVLRARSGGDAQNVDPPFVPMGMILPSDRDRLADVSAKWITEALGNFLDDRHFDIKKMACVIVASITSSASTFEEWSDLLHNIVGRLHPAFPLQRFHVCLRHRIRHLYFSLERLPQVPASFVFPEFYAAGDDDFQRVCETWRVSGTRCKRLLWRHWLSRGRSVGLLDHRAPPPDNVSLPMVGRNEHVMAHEKKRVPLEEMLPELGPYLLDEDIVPMGREAIGVFVQAPDYFFPTARRDALEPLDLLRFLDGFATAPSFKDGPLWGTPDGETREEDSEITADESDTDEAADECDIDEENVDAEMLESLIEE